jgi:hypothetical protein
MKAISVACALTFASGLSACAIIPDDPAVVAAANRPITCGGEADCREKWSRAVDWIAENAPWKIQLQTDDLIQTFGPGETGAEGDTDVAFSVTKTALGDGRYAIRIDTRCSNIFACVPSEAAEAAALANYIDPPR